MKREVELDLGGGGGGDQMVASGVVGKVRRAWMVWAREEGRGSEVRADCGKG